MGLNLQAGRGLVEDVIPPVEAELLSFSVAHLQTEGGVSQWSKAGVHAARKKGQLTPPLPHFTFTLMGSDMPFSARPRPFPAERAGSVARLQGGCD